MFFDIYWCVMGYLLILMLLWFITYVNFVIIITREVIPIVILMRFLLLPNGFYIFV